MALNATPPSPPSAYNHAHGFETRKGFGTGGAGFAFESSSHYHYAAHATDISLVDHTVIRLHDIARYNLTQPAPDYGTRPMVPFKAIVLSPTTIQIASAVQEIGWDLEYATSQSGSFDSDDAVAFANRQILVFAEDGKKIFLVGRVSGGGGANAPSSLGI